ncbi:MAG: glycosyltransferase family 39 protein [Actinomycetota bacterium]|nr:glycosyltransferase family 39 protein [Actinomycetota bacterium]
MSTTTTGPAPVPPGVPTWRLAAASFAPIATRSRVDAWLARLPLLAVLAVQALMSLRLGTTAFEDEALYIDAGHDLLAHWLHGAPVPDYGSFFSGAPAVYPVLAALLDSAGGLELVRAFSLVCMLVTTLCLRSVTTHLYGRRAGLLAAAAFAVTGPVAFLGAFATFDAMCVASLAVAAWLGVTRRTARTAAAAGAALALAVTLKYTGSVFVPAVLALTFLSTRYLPRRVTRTAVAAGVAAALLGTGFAIWGESLLPGIVFTTAGREALSPAPTSQLLGYVARDVGPLLLLALAGAALTVRSVRSGLLAAVFLGAAALLVVGQLRLGEAVSFEKHLAYSAVFLAPLAGRALSALSHRSLRALGVLAVLWVLLVAGLSRSHTLYQWPDVSGVVSLIESDPVAGRYTSTSARSLAYYTRDEHPQIQWDEVYGLFDSGEDAIRGAVTDRRYELIAFRSGSSGNPVEDQRLAVFVDAVQSSPDYVLATEPFPVRKWATEEWYVYRLR